jgi:hypothetical protein
MKTPGRSCRVPYREGEVEGLGEEEVALGDGAVVRGALAAGGWPAPPAGEDWFPK